jgi:hypothetical protein
MRKLLALMLCGIAATSTPAWAQTEELVDEGDDSGRWSVTVTPRYQKLFFLPGLESDGLESMDSWGASVAVRSPDSRFGVMATYMRGRGSGTYTYDDGFFSGDYAYRARRDELAITGEFTPSEANVTLMAGYHRFTARNDETLLNPAPGDSEVGAYRFSIDAAEIGLRLNSRLGANSRHSISAQFALGVGPGRARVNVREVFGGVETLTVESDSGTGYMGDIALGYNVFITDNVAIGTRIRGYVFYIDADIDEVDPIFAFAPELNLTFRF